MRNVTLAFLPLVAMGAALAQGPMGPGAPAAFSELKQYLGLTDAQVQQMQQARQQMHSNFQTLATQIREKRQALSTQLDSGTADAAAVGRTVLEIQALHKQQLQARETLRQNVTALLTAEQKTKLKNLEQTAELMAPVRQAMALGLLAPAAPGGIGRRGPFGGIGPAVPMGRGMRPGMGMRRAGPRI